MPAVNLDLHDELKEYNFDCWIFGHTHFSVEYDYENDDKKIIPFMSNPRGYYSDNQVFNEDKFIESLLEHRKDI